MANIAEEFYSNLYTSVNSKPDIKLPNVTNVGSEEIPDITIEELEHALSQIKPDWFPVRMVHVKKCWNLEGLQRYIQ